MSTSCARSGWRTLRFGTSDQSPGPFIHFILLKILRKQLFLLSHAVVGEDPQNQVISRKWWSFLVKIRLNISFPLWAGIILSSSKILYFNLYFFIWKFAVFNKEALNWSFFRQFSIYLIFIFYRSAARGCRQLRRRKSGGSSSSSELKNA